MPTTPRQARLLLRDGQATIARHEPFTIQLVHGSSGYKQPITLGVDAGYQTIGYSAVTAQEELIGGAVQLLRGQSERLRDRRMYRRHRRSRKRYRPSRFDNRRRGAGWLAPSIQHRLDAHTKLIDRLRAVLPISQVIIEVANFDIQKIKDPDISGAGYQDGEQQGYGNVREYVLHRDGHQCQNPACPRTTAILAVHHLGYWRRDRSDRPANLITLCIHCHAQRPVDTPENHQPDGFLHGWQPRLRSFRPETFMTTVRWRLTEESGAQPTYGYLTKQARRELGLAKSHHHDAFVIAGGAHQRRAAPTDMEEIRHHNRSRQRFYDAVYIDTRTGQRAYGRELHRGRTTRNQNLNGENLRRHRGQKVRPGRVSIRRPTYSLRPGDVVWFEGVKRIVKGVHAYGRRVYLRPRESGGQPRSVAISQVEPLRRRRGLVATTRKLERGIESRHR
ncbi:MAG: HNH endonuclease [Chloroflexi bacterium]|nr:HNH endonuclease [Chloroflexota bacterium]